MRAAWGASLLLLAAAPGAAAPLAAAPAQRVVSLNPSLTAILLALGAGEALVGVDDFSARQQDEVAGLPTVGGLYDPNLEAVLSLAPDLVVLVPSAQQRDFERGLRELGIRVERFANIRFDEVLENVQRLGSLTGREAAAQRRLEAIRRAREAVARDVRSRPRPRTVMVLQREPLYVVGGGSFLDEMLADAGAQNAGRAFDEPYPRVGMEWLVAEAPQVLLDASPDPQEPADYWSRWPSLPAVSGGRVVRVDPRVVTLPGPYLDRALRTLAVAIHGDGLGAPEADGDAAPGPSGGARGGTARGGGR